VLISLLFMSHLDKESIYPLIMRPFRQFGFRQRSFEVAMQFFRPSGSDADTVCLMRHHRLQNSGSGKS
jgi:hypothetical protein